ncbi:MAG TPA: hypothetical protein VK638_40985 [Edaphobacter sp.]|nr:hypothetical protein [Edaphobacter sp.]
MVIAEMVQGIREAKLGPFLFSSGKCYAQYWAFSTLVSRKVTFCRGTVPYKETPVIANLPEGGRIVSDDEIDAADEFVTAKGLNNTQVVHRASPDLGRVVIAGSKMTLTGTGIADEQDGSARSR